MALFRGRTKMDLLRIRSVEDTAIGAAIGKHSAVDRGYYVDPYIGYFVPVPEGKLSHQNLGSHFRRLVIQTAAVHFHDLHGNASQVVVLGCGFDTLFWRLRSSGIEFSQWIDLDKPDVVSRKRSSIESNVIFAPLLNYSLLAADLESFESDHVPRDMPTLFIDEFSLTYVNERSCEAIARQISSCEFVSYAMTGMRDSFGDMVIRTFDDLGAPLKSWTRTETPEVAVETLRRAGFERVVAVSGDEGVRRLLSNEEKEQIARLDFFDNPTGLAMILGHYITIYAGSEAFVSVLSRTLSGDDAPSFDSWDRRVMPKT
jgi:[phosphatase 2A protein]-leucine-carboxy methyltransferase